MADQSSPADWLPAGWTVGVRVRKNGRKDKSYTEPSTGVKLFSKPEVFRYLSNIKVKNQESQGTEKTKLKGSDETEPEVWESVAEGLPPGWIKEIRVTKRGGRIRKDSYYTDPVNGYVFRSMKEALRHLQTGELGRHVMKPKDKGRINGEIEDDKASVVAEGQNLAEIVSNRWILMNKNSKLNEVVEDNQTVESTCTEDCMSLAEHAANQCKEGVMIMSVNQTEAKVLKQSEENTAWDSISSPIVAEMLPEHESEEQVNNKNKAGLSKSNHKKHLDLPRRASKRLAGIDVDPLPELQNKTRARRVSAAQLKEAEGGAAGNLGDSAATGRCSGRSEAENNDEEMKGCAVVLPSRSTSGPELPKQVKTDNPKPDEEPGSPLNPSLKDLWMDPCIEFAIKTLTGAIPIEDQFKVNESSRPSLDIPFDSSWGDPCIEFAVKTLTGAIPLDDGLGIQDYLNPQTGMSQKLGDIGSILPHTGNGASQISDLNCQYGERATEH